MALSVKQMRLVALLADPENVSKPRKEIAEAAGVSLRTYYTWIKLPDLRDELMRQVRAIVPVEKHAKLVDTLVKKAQRGDSRALKIYLEWLGEIGAGVTIHNELSIAAGDLTVNFLTDGDNENSDRLNKLLGIVRHYINNPGQDKADLRRLTRRYWAGEPEALPAHEAEPEIIEAEIVEEPPRATSSASTERPPRTARVRGGEIITQRPDESDRSFKGRIVALS